MKFENLKEKYQITDEVMSEAQERAGNNLRQMWYVLRKHGYDIPFEDVKEDVAIIITH